MDNQSVDAYRNGFLCLLVCTALGIWFFMRIIKNRRKFNRNMELIGHELKRMEDKIRKSGNGLSEDEESLLADQSGMGLVDLLNQLHQKVTVDVFKMVVDSMSYLLLAGVTWILIKLVYACFWLPKHLKKELEEEEMKRKLEKEEEISCPEEEEDVTVQDKKND